MMTEKRLFEKLEGTIVKDKKGHRYRFHNGLLWGMCHLEPLKLDKGDDGMTAKRFTIQDERVVKDNEKYVTENGYVFSYKFDAEEVCNLLNELHEQIQSKDKVLHLAANKIETLLEENEQLKKEKESLIKGIKDTAKQGADSITAVWESKNRPTTINKGYYDR